MAGFNASTAVEALDYDFRPFVEAHGVVPEPSTDQITVYRKAIMDMFEEMIPEGLDDENQKTVDMIHKVVQFLGSDRSEEQEKILHVLADVCSDKPSYDELSALPYRHQQAFAGWVSGIFLLPSMPTPATTPLVAGPVTGQ